LNKRSHDKQLVKTISWLKWKNRKNDVNWFPSLKPFYFIMDIDYFKKFNDEYWHQTWDAVLHHFAQLINKLLRNWDNIYRYWWEEFSIITLPTNLEWAIWLANKIKNALI
jgi:diguanylate cyclase (GGDEF)-like protein